MGGLLRLFNAFLAMGLSMISRSPKGYGGRLLAKKQQREKVNYMIYK